MELCKKTAFADTTFAAKAVEEHAKKGRVLDYYKCSKCGAYHLTSQVRKKPKDRWTANANAVFEVRYTNLKTKYNELLRVTKFRKAKVSELEKLLKEAVTAFERNNYPGKLPQRIREALHRDYLNADKQ